MQRKLWTGTPGNELLSSPVIQLPGKICSGKQLVICTEKSDELHVN